jgi:hypothetical protein
MFGRIDASPLKNLSAYASFINSPTKTTGAFPAGLINQGLILVAKRRYEYPRKR